jgi:hypothetical protein
MKTSVHISIPRFLHSLVTSSGNRNDPAVGSAAQKGFYILNKRPAAHPQLNKDAGFNGAGSDTTQPFHISEKTVFLPSKNQL